MTLANIPVHSEAPHTGNLRPVQHEILQALTDLVTQEKSGMIDLHGLPFSEADYNALEAFLGEGDIDITLNVLGKTRIRESSYAGVWRLEHFDPNEQRIGYFIEIGYVPEILRSQCDDIKAGLDVMKTVLMMEEDVDETA